MSATFQKATAHMKTQTMTSKTPVIVRLHESTINAETMTLHWGENRAVFEGNVRTHIEREPDAVAAGQPEIGTVTDSGEATTGFTSNSNGAR
jgi:lipopolysaccharide export system protein LptC